MNGLGDKVGGIELEGLNRQFHFSEGGDNNHFFGGILFFDPFAVMPLSM